MPRTIGAIVVDHDVGPLLTRCVCSLLTDGVSRVVVVENGAADSVERALVDAPTDVLERVHVVRPGRNLGYGAGVNRGLAVLAGESPAPDAVLVSNADVIVHQGAVAGLDRALEEHPSWAVVGPRIFTDGGDVYPSVRSFPSFVDAAGHALLAQFKPDNPYTRRYNPGTPDGEVVVPADWVSGSCFLARREAFEELGGFDEAYFMYLEDTDLCWRAHHAGWGVGFAGTAAVTHVQGVSTARHPYRMLAAHHRSALRFTVRTTSGWRRAALPFAIMVLGVRMAMALVRQAVTR